MHSRERGVSMDGQGKGALFWKILAALATTSDGQTRLDEIAEGTQPIASLIELGNASDIDMTLEVSLLESLTTALNDVGIQEVIRRIDGGSANVERVEMRLRVIERLLVAIPECRESHVDQIAANIFEVLTPHFRDESESKLVAYAHEVALKVLEGESHPTPDQLIAGFQETLKSKRRKTN